MPKVVIVGKVIPSCFPVTFDIKPEISYRMEETGIDMTCILSIEQSIISVDCEVSRWDERALSGVLRRVSEWLNAEVDLFTFATGTALRVNLDRMVHPDGSVTRIMGVQHALAAIATVCKVTSSNGTDRVELHDLIEIVVREPTLMLALHDLCSALQYGNRIPANCGRALEGMRKSLWGKDEEDRNEIERSWAHFRRQLNLSKDYLQEITSASLGSRHGSSAYVPPSILEDILPKSWTVMNRVLLFYKGACKPLPESEYPIL